MSRDLEVDSVAEEKERSTPKSRIETLSDLIFGLALSIGALTLIGQAPSSFQNLVESIVYYAFSFLILISVWYGYTRIMSNVRIETRREVELNILLLFLVSIEPFLFNELNSSTLPIQYVSILYALDLGGLFAIQALLANSILADKKRPEELLRRYAAMRNAQIVGAAIFFISVLPFFWSLAIPITGKSSIPLRFILWIAPLFMRFIRRIWERQSDNT
jgi:uncharacterized membrane protein